MDRDQLVERLMEWGEYGLLVMSSAIKKREDLNVILDEYESSKLLPAEEIKPGRYRMTATMDVEVRKGPCAPLMKIEQVFGIYYLTDFPGATFQAVEEG